VSCSVVLCSHAAQCAGDGKRIQLDNLDPEIAPNAREQFEPEEHPDFDGMGQRCQTSATTAAPEMFKSFGFYDRREH
jgi:hypothetical protein